VIGPRMLVSEFPPEIFTSLGLTASTVEAGFALGAVHVFRQKLTLEDAIGSHACSLEASRCVTNGFRRRCPLFLPVHTVNCVQTLKAGQKHKDWSSFTFLRG